MQAGRRNMLKNVIHTLIGLGIAVAVIFGGLLLFSTLFHWNIASSSPALFLNIFAGIICLIWLLFILKVPWDLFFETRSILFEMQRSIEKQIPVNPDRMRYVR